MRGEKKERLERLKTSGREKQVRMGEEGEEDGESILHTSHYL